MKQTILTVIETKGNSKRVITNLSTPRSIWVNNKKINGNECEAPILNPIKVLTPFWKDVQSRIGMDVCTPFINAFKGHSFVAYDNNSVWSKTLKVLFITKKGITIHRTPNGCKQVRGFNSQLADLIEL